MADHWFARSPRWSSSRNTSRPPANASGFRQPLTSLLRRRSARRLRACSVRGDGDALDTRPLGVRLARALQAAGRASARPSAGRRHSLFISGFFSDSLRRSLVDVDYYMSLGGHAYGRSARSTTCCRRSSRSWPRSSSAFVDVLAEVSERTSTRPSDRICCASTKGGSAPAAGERRTARPNAASSPTPRLRPGIRPRLRECAQRHCALSVLRAVARNWPPFQRTDDLWRCVVKSVARARWSAGASPTRTTCGRAGSSRTSRPCGRWSTAASSASGCARAASGRRRSSRPRRWRRQAGRSPRRPRRRRSARILRPSAPAIFLFLSGQIPLDPATGQLVEGDIRAQTTRVLENLGELLKAGGADFSTSSARRSFWPTSPTSPWSTRSTRRISRRRIRRARRCRSRGCRATCGSRSTRSLVAAGFRPAVGCARFSDRRSESATAV